MPALTLKPNHKASPLISNRPPTSINSSNIELFVFDAEPFGRMIAAPQLASRYAMATRRVAETEGTEGWRLLREMCGDIVELRRRDHSAQRLVLERERAAARERDAHMKWKRKIITGLETLTKYAAKRPKAQAALEELARQIRHPFDPSESE